MRTASASPLAGLGLGLALALAAGCGPIDQPAATTAAKPVRPAPPAPPPPPPRIAALADLAGDWTGTDQDQWTYALHVDADGKFDQKVDRGGRGPCEQQGALTLDPPASGPNAPAGQAVGWAYQQNTCVLGYYGGQAIAEVRAYGPAALELHFTDGSVRYQRTGGAPPAPAAPAFATPPPSP